MPLNTSLPSAIISGVAGGGAGATSNSPVPSPAGLPGSWVPVSTVAVWVGAGAGAGAVWTGTGSAAVAAACATTTAALSMTPVFSTTGPTVAKPYLANSAGNVFETSGSTASTASRRLPDALG